jgi:hypothetical protein
VLGIAVTAFIYLLTRIGALRSTLIVMREHRSPVTYKRPAPPGLSQPKPVGERAPASPFSAASPRWPARCQEQRFVAQSLFPVFFGVHLPRLLSEHARVRGMAACCMRVMRRFLVIAGFVVFGGFTVMPRVQTLWCDVPQLSLTSDASFNWK